MARAPLVPSVSEYHAVIVPIVVAAVFALGGELRDQVLDAGGVWLIVLYVLMVGSVFWNGIRPGKTTPNQQATTVGLLLIIQVIVGAVLGSQGVESRSLLGQLFGGTMFSLAVYRFILLKIDAIDESYFEEADLSTKGVIAMIGVGVVLVGLTVLFSIPDLFSVSIAFFVADAFTAARKRSQTVE